MSGFGFSGPVKPKMWLRLGLKPSAGLVWQVFRTFLWGARVFSEPCVCSGMSGCNSVGRKRGPNTRRQKSTKQNRSFGNCLGGPAAREQKARGIVQSCTQLNIVSIMLSSSTHLQQPDRPIFTSTAPALWNSTMLLEDLFLESLTPAGCLAVQNLLARTESAIAARF